MDHSFLVSYFNNYHHGQIISTKSDIGRFGDDLRNDLFPNIPTFFGNVIATIILLFVIIRYAYAPFRESQRRKHEYIKNQIASANQKYSESVQNQKQAEIYLRNASAQSKKIINQSKIEATEMKGRILTQATAHQKKILLDTKMQVEYEKTMAASEIKNQSIELAKEIATKIIDKEIAKQTMDDTINDFLKHIDTSKPVNKKK